MPYSVGENDVDLEVSLLPRYVRSKSRLKRSDVAAPHHSMLTRGKALQMTKNAVLNTGELLEKIILHLPHQAQLRLRATSKLWNHIVLTLVHKIEYVRPPTPVQGPERSLSKTGTWVFDTRTQQLQTYDSVDSYIQKSQRWKRRQLHMRPSVINPHLFTLGPFRSHLLERAEKCESIRFADPLCLRLLSNGQVEIARGNAAWKMEIALCNPAVSQVHVMFFYHVFVRDEETGQPLRVETQFSRKVMIGYKNGPPVCSADILRGFFWGRAAGGVEEEEENLLVESYDGLYEIATEPETNFDLQYDEDGGLRVVERLFRGSCVWMLGAVFADEDDMIRVEGSAKRLKALTRGRGGRMY